MYTWNVPMGTDYTNFQIGGISHYALFIYLFIYLFIIKIILKVHKTKNKTKQKKQKLAQKAETSAERQHNRIAEWLCRTSVLCVLTTWQFFWDPDSDADRHQNVISWSVVHTGSQFSIKISSKSVHNFFSYPTEWQTDRQTDKQTEVKT